MTYKTPLPLLFFSLTLLLSCTAIDNTTITPTHYITDTQTITSTGEIYKLGFFSPVNSTNRYVGIWYNKISVQTIVWVANRDNPLNDSSGVLRIANDGNLVLVDGPGMILWSTNVSNIPFNSSIAELFDSGNLILRQASDQRIIWQSFEDPTDTFLPTMQIGANMRTGETIVIRSWKSESNPSTGNFVLRLGVIGTPQIEIWNGSLCHWRSGPWNNRIFIGIASMYSVYLDGFYIVRNALEDTAYMTYNYFNKSSFTRYVLDHSGNLLGERWDEGVNGWHRFLSSRDNGECDVYDKCGPFGNCNILDSPICSCLRGFTPKSEDEWNKWNWSDGCVRKTELQCERHQNSTSSSSIEGEKEDAFLKLETMKVPDFAFWNAPRSLSECGQECLKNCSCSAYSYDSGVGCMLWDRTLVDIQKFSKGAGVDLYIRLAHSDLDEKKSKKVIIIITVLIGTFTVSVGAYFCWWWMAKQRGIEGKEMEISLFNIDNNIDEESPDMLGDNPDLKILKFDQLAIATSNFSAANKLGEGGFGSVYKGKLTDEQEIAVKRLSKGSGQGLVEFKNEVLVISKLQHRNLVRLLGCCIEGEEKMLIYEYMPNKSLDAFLFDSTKRACLNWNKRFQIIEGISRGILYLHRDSRLRVIHRDLKASNILLDEELNPKISDFGMARIFGGNEMQERTRRVVGTYGYMSPEYAMEGRFSEKSDVFSFGVLLLEIVSGKRNSIFYHHDLSLSLLGYVWHLWNENKTETLIDPNLLSEQISELEILRCIQVGLLCVQEHAIDRPTMSTILSMLTSEIATLPTPKQPAFIERRVHSESSSSQKSSANIVTMTSINGR